MNSLKEVQDTYARLWTTRAAREAYLAQNLEAQDQRGVRLYANLIEIGRLDLMTSIYPTFKALLGKKFKDLVHSYYECMPPDNYNLNQSAKKFAVYLRDYEPKLLERHPFICELADYEWIELEVLEALDNPDKSRVKAAQEAGDAVSFAALRPVLTEVYRLRRYKYPVPEIARILLSGQKLPRRVKAEPTYSVIYRDKDDFSCRFLEVEELAMAIIEKMHEHPEMNYGDLIKFAVSVSDAGPQETVDAFLELVESLKESSLIVFDR